ncbi:MAG: hypothetical protein ACXW3B_14940 [Telluria sp.]
MKHPEYVNALIAPHKVHIFGSVLVKHIVAALFIGIVALFATAPTDESGSVFDAPIPLPAELGLE